MSAYVTVATEYRDEDCLVQSLEEMGYTVERHKEAQTLYDYHGQKRPERANVIIRRKYVGSLANDIGFVKGEDGNYRSIISEYDGSATFRPEKQKVLAKSYAQKKVIKQAKAKGYQVVEQKTDGGKIKLTLRKW